MSGGCCLLGNLCLRRYCKARNCQISPRRLLGTPTKIKKQGLELWNEVGKSQLRNNVMLENRQLYCPACHPLITQYDALTEAYSDKFNPVTTDALRKKTSNNNKGNVNDISQHWLGTEYNIYRGCLATQHYTHAQKTTQWDRQSLLSPLSRWPSWDRKKLSNWPKFVQLVNGSLELELPSLASEAKFWNHEMYCCLFPPSVWFEASNKCQYL